MSDVQVTPPAKGGGGVNPSFTATAFFPSGLNASGLVQVPSGFFASGLEASALVKGTIGQFLATALAGSGVNASGQVGGASGIFKSGISAPDLEVSTINGAPPGTTTSTFTSGLTTCALVSVGASLIVDGSAVMESTLNLSGQLTAASALVACGLNLSAQAQLASAVVESGLNLSAQLQAASIIAESGVNLSGAIQGTTASFTGISGSTYTGASGVFLSGVNLSAVLQAGTSILASGDINASQLTVRGGASMVGSVALGSAMSVLGTLRVSGATTVASTLEASGTLSAANINTSTETNTALLSVGGSILGQSGATFSGLVSATSFAGQFAFTSVDAPSGGTLSALLSLGASALIACTLAVSGLGSIGGSLLAESGIATACGVIASGALIAGAGRTSIGGSLMVLSQAIFSGGIIPETPSTSPPLRILLATGHNTSVIVISGVAGGATGIFNIDQSGNLGTLGTLSAASGVFQSGMNTSAAVFAGNIISAGASGGFTSGVDISATLALIPPSTAASAGGLAILCIILPTGTQTSYLIEGSVGATQMLTLTASGTLSTLNVNASTFNGAPLTTGASATYPSGLTACALASFGASVNVVGPLTNTGILSQGASAVFSSGANTSADVQIGGNLSVTGNAVFFSGLNLSGTETAVSVLVACTFAVSGVASFGGSVLAGSTISTSAWIAISPGSQTQSAGGLALISIGLPSGMQASYLLNYSFGNVGGAITLGLGGLGSFAASLHATSGINLSGTETVVSTLIACTLAVSGAASVGGTTTLNGLTKVQGGLQHGVASINASLTLSAGNGIVLADTSTAGSAVTVLLPSAATVSGQIFYVVKRDSSANSVIVAAQTTDSIEGVSQVNAGTQYGKFHLTNAGSVTWYNFGSGLI